MKNVEPNISTATRVNTCWYPILQLKFVLTAEWFTTMRLSSKRSNGVSLQFSINEEEPDRYIEMPAMAYA